MPSKPPTKPEPAYHRRKAQRPEEILHAGLAEFDAHGFAGASLARIAKRAGVSRATLYLYYDNKSALFLAVAQDLFKSFVADGEKRLEMQEGTTQEMFRLIVTQFYGTITDPKNTALLRILISEGPQLPDLVEQYHAQVISRARALLRNIIARGIARGEVREAAATQLPEVIISPVMFYAVNTMVFSRIAPLDADAFMEGHIDLVLNGILTQT